MNALKVSGSTAVISGASSGIGAATAVEFGRVGARAVALIGRRKEALERVAEQVRATGARAEPYVADLNELYAIPALAQRISAELGAPEILVNNAGAGRWLFPEETELSEAVAMMNVPYGCAFALTQAFLPAMLAARRGHIVNLSSPACFFAWPGATAYAVARWAMRGLSDALEADLHGTGVNVSLVVPGKVNTEYFGNNPGTEARLPGTSRFYRTLSPSEVAALIVRAVDERKRLLIRPWSLALTEMWGRCFPGSVRTMLHETGAKRTTLPLGAQEGGDAAQR
jgi:short-subunit dehydrogenase